MVGECVSAGGVCVNRAGSGQYMGNTARETTSPARMKGDFSVEVRRTHFKNLKYYEI